MGVCGVYVCGCWGEGVLDECVGCVCVKYNILVFYCSQIVRIFTNVFLELGRGKGTAFTVISVTANSIAKTKETRQIVRVRFNGLQVHPFCERKK